MLESGNPQQTSEVAAMGAADKIALMGQMQRILCYVIAHRRAHAGTVKPSSMRSICLTATKI